MAARLFFSKSFKKVLLSSGVYVILKYLSACNIHYLLGCALSYTKPLFLLVFTAGLGSRKQTMDVLNSPAFVGSAGLRVSRAQVLDTFTRYLSASIFHSSAYYFLTDIFSVVSLGICRPCSPKLVQKRIL